MAAPAGNRNAAKSKEWHLALKRALARKGNGDFRKALDSIADSVVASASDGDKDAWQDIANRFDGKPAQSIELDATVTSNDFASLPRTELELIASGIGSEGTAEPDEGSGEPNRTH